MFTTRILPALFLLAFCGGVAAAAEPKADALPSDSGQADPAIARLVELVAGQQDGGFQAFAVNDDLNDGADLKLGPSRKSPAPAAADAQSPAARGAAAPARRTAAATGKSAASNSAGGRSAGGRSAGGKSAGGKSGHKPVAIPLKIADGADVEQAWSDYFAKHEDVPQEDVRETVRQLVAKKRFGEVAAVINGALRSGQAQSWMYEALGLAMQAAGSPKAEIERVLMSACDFGEDVADLMYVAQYLARSGLEQRAIKVFRQAATLDPTRTEPLVYGLQIAQRLNDPEGIEWASLGILSQAWPRDKQELEKTAYRAALALVEQLKSEHKTKEAAQLRSKVEQALVRDCKVQVTWTGDADVDVFIEEPAGTICSFRNPRTTSGGVMLGDVSSPEGKPLAPGSSSETYVCPQAFSGSYKLLLRRVWGKVTAGKVTVDVWTHWGSKYVKTFHHQIPLGDQDTIATFDLEDGRRREPLAEQQVVNAAVGQVALNQAILNQQLNSSSSTGTGNSFGTSRAGLFGAFPLIQQAVGYQPVIITLPAGANFTATGVISADRRYVRVTVLPLFSQIGMVTTFNIASGAVGSSPTPPPGGGGVSGGTNGFPPPPSTTGAGT